MYTKIYAYRSLNNIITIAMVYTERNTENLFLYRRINILLKEGAQAWNCQVFVNSVTGLDSDRDPDL